jgi:hypothetical protein
MAKYQIQVGRCQGAFHTRYSLDNHFSAEMYYRGLNVGRGYKKRIKEDGRVIAKTAPDMDYCPSPSSKRAERVSFLGGARRRRRKR